ncbi:MAG: PLP-dependent transferase [Rhodobacteraceae bacterium]|nr:PLP-dependent transferase [Paracoccaceae bacterium]
MTKPNQLNFDTRAIHAGQEPDPLTGAVVTPIIHATTFVQDGIDKNRGFVYSRSGNPTRLTVEACLADLESAKTAFAFPTGLSAAATILECVDAGAHIVAHADLYGGIHRLLNDVRTRSAGHQVTFVDFADTDAVAGVVNEKTTLLWYETPSNPMLKIVDIAAISQIAKSVGAMSVCDNTFSSPYLQRPLELGVDIVMHSATKFLSGHSDLMAGVAAVSASAPDGVAERLKLMQNATGAVLSAMDSSLLLRSVKTLPVRMERHCSNAKKITEHLLDNQTRYGITSVRYPGLPDHPGHDVAARQMRDFGSMISLYVDGGLQRLEQVMQRSHLFQFAVSLGGVESLIQHPASLTHKTVPKEKRDAEGVTDDLIRLSVGIEDASDLIADIKQAFG